MTRDVERRIYGAVVRLHPANFREEFGREMELDFEDALEVRGFAALLGDALLSLGRQWRAHAFAGPEIAQPVPSRPFLAGQYMMVDQGRLTAFDLATAFVLSSVLVLAIGFAASVPNRHAIANLQAARAGHDGGIDTGGNGAPVGGERGRRELPNGEVIPLAFGSGAGARRGPIYLGRGRGTTGPGWGPRATGHDAVQAETLVEALFQFMLISVVIWTTSFFFRRNSGVGRRAAVATLGLLAIAASVAFGQAPAVPGILRASGPVPAFEVATVKLNDPSVRFMVTPPGSQQIVHTAAAARGLVAQAYELSPLARVVGGPEWAAKDIFRIEAKIPDDAYAAMEKMSNDERRNQAMLMMQGLLADRFKLKMHVETREMPVWELTVAKSGPKLPAENAAGPPAGADDVSRARLTAGGEAVAKDGVLIRYMTLDGMLTAPWFGLNDRPIVNDTGLTGRYNLKLNWIPDVPRQATNPDGPPAVPEGQASIFTVLEEQLGLKLVSAKAQVEVVVIDSIERPGEN